MPPVLWLFLLMLNFCLSYLFGYALWGGAMGYAYKLKDRDAGLFFLARLLFTAAIVAAPGAAILSYLAFRGLL